MPAIPILFANNATSNLAGAITSAATSANLTAGTGASFPQPGDGQYFVMTFVDAATGLLNEIIHVTAIVGDVVTIIRGQEGTAPRAWQAADIAVNYWTAGSAAALFSVPVIAAQQTFNSANAGASVALGTACLVEMWGVPGSGGGASGESSIGSGGGGATYARFLVTGIAYGAAVVTSIPVSPAGGAPGSIGTAGGAVSITIGGRTWSVPGGGGGVGASAGVIAAPGGAGGGAGIYPSGYAAPGNVFEVKGQSGGTGFEGGAALIGGTSGFGYGAAGAFASSSATTSGPGIPGQMPGQAGSGGIAGGNGGQAGPACINLTWYAR